jgi:hypothetical protein
MGQFKGKTVKQMSASTPTSTDNLVGLVFGRENKTTTKRKKYARFSVMVVACGLHDDESESLTMDTTGVESQVVVKRYSRISVKCFDASDSITEGHQVVLAGVTAWRGDQGGVAYSAKCVKYMSDDTLGVLNKIPVKHFHFPQLEDVKQRDFVYPIRTQPQLDTMLNNQTGAGIVIHTVDPSNLVFEKDGTRTIALRNAMITATQWNNNTQETIWIDAPLYDSHLNGIGITDVETWMNLAPYLVPHLCGYFVGYIDTAKSMNLDLNNGLNTGASSRGLCIKALWNQMQWDMKSVIKSAAIEVSYEYVKETLGCETLESHHQCQTGDVINLCEYTGNISKMSTTHTFWCLSNLAMEKDDIEEIQAMSKSDREACLRKTPGCAVRVRYCSPKTVVFYAMKTTVTGKRTRD